MQVTETHARKFLEMCNHGLTSGLGRPKPGEMCVEAVWCNVLGLPHGDDPRCVAPSLRKLKIRLNDSSWSSNDKRADGLRRLGLAQVGSLGELDENEFVKRVSEMTIRIVVPKALRAAAKVNLEHADKLESAAVKCESEGTAESAKEARKSAAYAAAAAAYAAAAAAAYAYADADAGAAAYAYAAAAAAYAAADAGAAAYAAAAAADAAAAAYVAAYVAAYAAAADAADAAAAARDELLADFAERVVQILIDMKAPGCQWLYLTETN